MSSPGAVPQPVRNTQQGLNCSVIYADAQQKRQTRIRTQVLAIGLAVTLSACSQGDSQYTVVADQPATFTDSTDTADFDPEPEEAGWPNSNSNLPEPELPTSKPARSEPPPASETTTTKPDSLRETTSTSESTTTQVPTSQPTSTSEAATTTPSTSEPTTTSEAEILLSPFCQQAEVFQSVLAEIQAKASVLIGQAERTEQLAVAAGAMVEISPVQYIAELAAMQWSVVEAATVLDEDGWQPATITTIFEELSQQHHLSEGPSSTGAVTYNQSVARYWDLNCTR